MVNVRRVLRDSYTNQPILVWTWANAPKELQALSPHGGDEDWVAYVPGEMDNMYISWLESGSSFGCCDVSTHKTVCGGTVHIGAHS